jgi:hypothetical protein
MSNNVNTDCTDCTNKFEDYVLEYIKDIPMDSIEREKQDLDQDILKQYNYNKEINSKLEHICKDYVNVKKKVILYKNELDRLDNKIQILPHNNNHNKEKKRLLQKYRDVEYTYDKFYDEYCLLRERFYKQYYQKYKISKNIQYNLKRKCKIMNTWGKQWSEFINHIKTIPKSPVEIHSNKNTSFLRNGKNMCFLFIDENGPPSSRTRSKFLINK